MFNEQEPKCININYWITLIKKKFFFFSDDKMVEASGVIIKSY